MIEHDRVRPAFSPPPTWVRSGSNPPDVFRRGNLAGCRCTSTANVSKPLRRVNSAFRLVAIESGGPDSNIRSMHSGTSLGGSA
jgi:hypothetical protein